MSTHLQIPGSNTQMCAQKNLMRCQQASKSSLVSGSPREDWGFDLSSLSLEFTVFWFSSFPIIFEWEWTVAWFYDCKTFPSCGLSRFDLFLQNHWSDKSWFAVPILPYSELHLHLSACHWFNCVESPGSGGMGVIGALVYLIPSEAVWVQPYFP